MSLKSYSSSGFSGKKDATSSFVAIASTPSSFNGHLLVQVEATESAGVEVAFLGMTDGVTVAPGESISFLCDDLQKVLVKRIGSSDIEFRYWAF